MVEHSLGNRLLLLLGRRGRRGSCARLKLGTLTEGFRFDETANVLYSESLGYLSSFLTLPGGCFAFHNWQRHFQHGLRHPFLTGSRGQNLVAGRLSTSFGSIHGIKIRLGYFQHGFRHPSFSLGGQGSFQHSLSHTALGLEIDFRIKQSLGDTPGLGLPLITGLLFFILFLHLYRH